MSSTRSHRPRRRFGQNFLHDPGVIRRIVAAIDPGAGDLMVEIGPGEGALSRPLLAHLRHLHVVELDRDLAAALRQGPLAERMTVHEGDALRFDVASLASGPGTVRVVGNLPYNISSPLLFHVLEQQHAIRDLHFMLQREVVERMAAAPGGRIFGRLSVMVQARCQVEMLFRVAAGAFRPAPEVESAVVRLTPRPEPPRPELLSALGLVTTRAFAQRRKTLRNSLKGVMDAAAVQAIGLDPGARPETLSSEDFLRLARQHLETRAGGDKTCG